MTSRALKWTDVFDIAIALEEIHPDVDVTHIRFTDLWKMVLDLTDFQDLPENSNEKILEAIQAAWLAERD
jgi:FeS assembly protein IscX